AQLHHPAAAPRLLPACCALAKGKTRRRKSTAPTQCRAGRQARLKADLSKNSEDLNWLRAARRAAPAGSGAGAAALRAPPISAWAAADRVEEGAARRARCSHRRQHRRRYRPPVVQGGATSLRQYAVEFVVSA